MIKYENWIDIKWMNEWIDIFMMKYSLFFFFFFITYYFAKAFSLSSSILFKSDDPPPWLVIIPTHVDARPNPHPKYPTYAHPSVSPIYLYLKLMRLCEKEENESKQYI